MKNLLFLILLILYGCTDDLRKTDTLSCMIGYEAGALKHKIHTKDTEAKEVCDCLVNASDLKNVKKCWR